MKRLWTIAAVLAVRATASVLLAKILPERAGALISTDTVSEYLLNFQSSHAH